MKRKHDIAGGPKGQRVCSKRTICEVHRQIYDLLVLSAMDDEVRRRLLELVAEAFDMGVRMTESMIERKCEMLHWEINPNREEVRRLRQLRVEVEKGRQAWQAMREEQP